MVKLLFAGPSLAGAELDPGDIELRPPASHGDIAAATLQGATVIGLVDGLFDAVAAVWHKEILFALSEGVQVLGAASMGALRAAECAPFGMQPVGAIALSYLTGKRDDDADVGLVHAPAELGYLPLTEPIVDIEATLAPLVAAGALPATEAASILAHARSIFFGDRSAESVLPPTLSALRNLLETHRVQQKRLDALELVARMRELPDARVMPPDFTLSQSPMWRRRLAVIAAEAGVTLA